MCFSRVFHLAAILLLTLTPAAACASPPSATPTPQLPAVSPSPADSANPASRNCQDKGGRLEIVTLPDGPVGVCVFADGSLCEEWAYFRDECRPGQFLPFTVSLEPGLDNPADQFCLENDGQLALLRLSTGAEYGLCVWPSGTICEQSTVLRQECKP